MRVRTPATGGQSVVAIKLLKSFGRGAVAPAAKTKRPGCLRDPGLSHQTEVALHAIASARIEWVRIKIHWLLMLKRIRARCLRGKRTRVRHGALP